MPRKPLRQVIVPIGPSIAYVPLTRGQFALIDREDADWIGKSNWQAWLSPTMKTFYATRKLYGGKVNIALHMAILMPDRGLIPDHRNGSTLDDRRANLREATPSQNRYNSRMYRSNASGYKGVHRISEHANFTAKLAVNKKRLYLGSYETAEEANAVVRAAAIEHHGEFANMGGR